MHYIHVLQREGDPHFGSPQHMVYLVDALVASGYLVAVVDCHHMFEDVKSWLRKDDMMCSPREYKGEEESSFFYMNRDESNVILHGFWDDLGDWLRLNSDKGKSDELFIVPFITHDDIHELVTQEPKSFPLKANLVLAVNQKYQELRRIIHRINAYQYSEATIKWFLNSGRIDVLSRHKDRNVKTEEAVIDFDCALRESYVKS